MRRGGERVTIVGAGPAGNLLAIFLARRGIRPLVIERRSRADMHEPGAGRSINLALAARGIAALRAVELSAVVEPLMLPMLGRMIHEPDEPQRFAPYGQTAGECIYSISRARLNLELYRIAHERHGVEYRFNCECRDVDPVSLAPIVPGKLDLDVSARHATFAADGAGSAIRRALVERGAIAASETLLEHGYKELTLPPGAAGEFVLDAAALHVWPRDDYMLIALPNTDRSFTATLFLPLEGPISFRALDDGAAVSRFFRREFPDAAHRIPDLERQFAANPVGMLGTVRCEPWAHFGAAHSGGRQASAKLETSAGAAHPGQAQVEPARGSALLLVGDAAHAIVPFHGQGMNAAFEDVAEIDRLIDAHGCDWPRVFTHFEALRQPNAAAIADMALDNYLEMRALVRDRKFRLARELELELERRFPGRFIPRYAMVMFHPEISYAEAQRRGARQRELLERLTRDAATLADVDFDLAARQLDA